MIKEYFILKGLVTYIKKLRLLQVVLASMFTLGFANNLIAEEIDIQDGLLIQNPPQAKIITVSGVVKDSQGNPFPGVSVFVEGGNGTSTDFNGLFSLNVAVGEKLTFSFMGMQTQVVTIADNTTSLSIVLVEDAALLDEIVVMDGYQAISKERATGSYVNIQSEVIEQRPVATIKDAIGGLATGVQQRGNDFLIRGLGTFSSDTAPLVVIDGFPIQTSNPYDAVNPSDVESVNVLKDAAATSIYGSRAGNGVIVITTKKASKGSLNVNYDSFVSISDKIDLDHAFNMAGTASTIKYMEDIESLVPAVGLSSWGNPYNNPAVTRWNIAPHVALMWERRQGNISLSKYENQKNLLIEQDGIWKDQYSNYLLRNRVYQQHSLTLSSGTEKGSSRLNLLYSKDLTDYTYNNADKYLMNYSNIYNISSRVQVGVTMNGILDKNQMNGTNVGSLKSVTSPYSRLLEDDGSYTYMANGIYLPYLQNGKVNESIFPFSWRYNALEEARVADNNSTNYNARLNAFVNVDIIDGLKASFSAQYELVGNNVENYTREGSYSYRSAYNTYSVLNTTTGLRTINPDMPKVGAMVAESSWQENAFLLRAQLNYDKTFNDVHRVTLLGAAEALSKDRLVLSTSIRPGFNEDNYVIDRYTNYNIRLNSFEGGQGSPPWSLGGRTYATDRFVSGLFNGSYTYDGKYTVTGSARVDGSNFVAETVNQKLSPFWSVGTAWNANKENFIKENLEFVDILQVKATYGVGGTAPGRSFLASPTTIGTYQLNNVTGAGATSSYIQSRENPDLTWEKSYTFNVSTDFSLWKGALTGSFGYYNRKSTDVLMSVPMSYAAAGTSQLTVNAGDITNSGIELQFGSMQKITDNISWSGSLNFTYNKNNVDKWELDRPYVNTYAGGSYPIKDHPIGTVYAFTITGYDTATGLLKVGLNDGTEIIADTRNNTMFYSLFDVANGESVHTNNRFTKNIGTTVAPMFGGFRNSFKVYDFTLSFIMTGEFGHIFNRGDDYGYSATNYSYAKTLEKAWNMGDDASQFTYRPYPNATNAAYLNSGFLNLYYTNIINYANTSWESASHIRLNEVFLGYDIPVKSLFGANSNIKSANVYVQARNLGLIWAANDKGLDPYFLPGNILTPKTFTFGLKLNI